MQQLEIPYFFPLTEQVQLDLDFKPCYEYEDQKRKEWAASSVTLTSGIGLLSAGTSLTWAVADPSYQKFQVLPDGAVGSWEVTPNMSVGRKSKPKLLHRIFTKFMLGWEWKDK